VLWEIGGKDLPATSYLLGTLKFTSAEHYHLPDDIQSRIKKAGIFAIEDQVDHHAQHELNKALHFQKGKSLETELSKADYYKVVSFFEERIKMTPTGFNKKYGHLKPLPLSPMIMRLSLHEEVKFYDIELLVYAKKNGLQAYSLEEIEREAAAINSFNIADQTKALLHSIENFNSERDEYVQLMKEYPRGDAKKIYEYTIHHLDNNEVFIEEFYIKRNKEWMPKIEKMMREKPAFIAVGLTHLEGEQSLIALLQAKGYDVTPVQIK